MRPGRRERRTVRVTGQIAAQLDGLPVLPMRCSGEPALRSPGRLRLVLARLGLRPFLTVLLQLAAVLALDRVILGRPLRSADLFAHWHASLRRTAGAVPSHTRWWLTLDLSRLPPLGPG